MPLFHREIVRTGIDIGAAHVKLVRGVGLRRLDRITHVGMKEWSHAPSGDDAPRAAEALRLLLERLGLNRRQLGRVAVAIGGEETSLREAVTAIRTPKELRHALPFEARKHLDLEGMASPVLDAQILGPAPPEEEGGAAQARVLFAAAPKTHRDFPIRTLARLRIEPQIVDLEALAALNAVFAGPAAGDEGTVGVLDLGAHRAAFHATSRTGGLLSRLIPESTPPEVNAASAAAYARRLRAPLRETLTFYRARHRREVDRIFLAGGGAYVHEITSHLEEALDRPVAVLDPLDGLVDGAAGADRAILSAACFVTACGLCRWWDETGFDANHV